LATTVQGRILSRRQQLDPGTIGLNTGVTNSQDFGLPLIRIHDDLGIANIGATLSVPRARTDINYQLIGQFSWKRSRHD